MHFRPALRGAFSTALTARAARDVSEAWRSASETTSPSQGTWCANCCFSTVWALTDVACFASILRRWTSAGPVLARGVCDPVKTTRRPAQARAFSTTRNAPSSSPPSSAAASACRAGTNRPQPSNTRASVPMDVRARPWRADRRVAQNDSWRRGLSRWSPLPRAAGSQAGGAGIAPICWSSVSTSR